MKNYLVTGAAGFIGSAVAKRLISLGNYVVSIDNLSTGKKSNIPEGVVFIEGDCGDPEIYTKVPNKNYDAIIHIAGQSSGEISFDDPVYDIKTNAVSTLLLLKYALDTSCKRFIYASSMSVYGKQPDQRVKEGSECNPLSFYGVGKLASEHYLEIYRTYGIETTSLRLFNVYGPGQNLENLKQGMVSIYLAQIHEKDLVEVKGSLDRYRDFIYIDDVVDAFESCLTGKGSEGEIINIGTGMRTTVEELLALLFELQQKKLNIKNADSTAGDLFGIYADITKMKTILGIEKPKNLIKGLTEMNNWLSNQG
tara:strand:- start:5204 stop:6130 length:927 start_codon:yes stop_codon:yes gene_type:complete